MEDQYLDQFKRKEDQFIDFFSPLTSEISSYKSPELGFRTRAEFGIFLKKNSYEYSMIEQKSKVFIDQLVICHPKINKLMIDLKIATKGNKEILNKLFSCEFKVTKLGKSIICLNYHREIDEDWKIEAKAIAEELQINLIGRSRKKKFVAGKDYIKEIYNINSTSLELNLYENCFSQPNPYICEKILEWIRDLGIHSEDVLELHCGIGTFTILLSSIYNKVLATENSRPSIKALKDNINMNQVKNISFARLSGHETIEALSKKREFRRLRNIDLDSFNLSTVLLDPPRMGLDSYTRENLKGFKNIIYISCGFKSLKEDLKKLKTHKVKKASFFDQFPYTDHLESAVLLEKI